MPGTLEKSSYTERGPERPDPEDLQAFLPWACGQMQVSKDVVINKNLQYDYVSSAASERGKSKMMKSRPKLPSNLDFGDQDKDDASGGFTHETRDSDTVVINGVYDHSDHLVGLKFEKNTCLPGQLFQLLGLVIKFQTYLTSLTLNRGINKYVINEIAKFLPISKVTELCFDNSFLSEGTYYTLLEKPNNLRSLSLSRCRINDEVVALIAALLYHPKPASTSLVILNLSSNRITDVGALHIREALKMNSKLAYLNLADNMLTDTGAASILNVLCEFPVTKSELTLMRQRHVQYLKDKQDFIKQLADNLRMSETKSKKQTVPRSGRGRRNEKDTETILSLDKSTTGSDPVFYEKAQTMAENMMPPFKDPYSLENVVIRNTVTYCLGNNALQLLNLSYNNLMFPSVQKLLNVLLYQKDLDRKPRGLLNCRMDGNQLPEGCKEMIQIDDILETNLSGPGRRLQLSKKKGK